LISLTCPTCSHKLQITDDINRFACTYCGNEHIVKRSGGIVSLVPVIESIRDVGEKIDRVNIQLEIQRLIQEREILTRQALAQLELIRLRYDEGGLIGFVSGYILGNKKRDKQQLDAMQEELKAIVTQVDKLKRMLV